MDREPVLLKIDDPENLVLVYLLIKAFILVFAHYFDLSMRRTLVAPFLF